MPPPVRRYHVFQASPREKTPALDPEWEKAPLETTGRKKLGVHFRHSFDRAVWVGRWRAIGSSGTMLVRIWSCGCCKVVVAVS